MSQYRFVQYLVLPVDKDGSTVTLYACIGKRFAPFVLHQSGDLYLPLVDGETFSLRVINRTPAHIALPVRVGDGTTWTNLWRECPITEPASMPSIGGMWELQMFDTNSVFGPRPWTISINGFVLPDGVEHFGFSNANEALNVGHRLNTIEVYYRALLEYGTSAVPGTTDVTCSLSENSRLLTPGDHARHEGGNSYEQQATLLGVIKLASRHRLAAKLAEAGIKLNANDASRWSPSRLRFYFPERYSDDKIIG